MLGSVCSRRLVGLARVAAILPMLAVVACSGAEDGAGPPTTEASALRSDLITARDLGPDYAPVGVEITDGPCRVELRGGLDHAVVAFVSNAAQEAVRAELSEYASPVEAAEAFEHARSGSACDPSEFGDEGGRPIATTIRHAEEAFSIDYADPNGAAAATVALVGEVVVVVHARIHNGAATTEPLGSNEVAARQVAQVG